MSGDIPTRHPAEFFRLFHGERDMIEADKASTGIYEVSRMSRAAMTHLIFLTMSSIWPKRAKDIFTKSPGTYQQDVLQSFQSLFHGIIGANDASKVISEVKRAPLAASKQLLITKGPLRNL